VALPNGGKNHDDKRIRFDTTPQRGGPTDREKRYNNIALCMLARMLTRDKNCEIGSFFIAEHLRVVSNALPDFRARFYDYIVARIFRSHC